MLSYQNNGVFRLVVRSSFVFASSNCDWLTLFKWLILANHSFCLRKQMKIELQAERLYIIRECVTIQCTITVQYKISWRKILEKSFQNLSKSNRNQIVFNIFRLIYKFIHKFKWIEIEYFSSIGKDLRKKTNIRRVKILYYILFYNFTIFFLINFIFPDDSEDSKKIK